MKKIAITAALGGFLGMMWAPACSSSETGTTSTTTTTSSASGTGGSGGAGAATVSTGTSMGQGGGAACVEVTNVTNFSRGQSSFSGIAEPNFAGADPDYLVLYVPAMAKGKTALAPVTDAAVCGDTEPCIVVYQDATDMGAAATFLAKGGELDIASFDGQYLITGSLTDVAFEEVTIDDMTGAVTPVKDGKCVHLAKFAFDIKPPVDGWTCNPGYYDETKAGSKEIYCDCECGAVDPDCANAMNAVDGCLKGQTCGAKATCEGVPTAWTCAKEKFNGGVGNGCDCGCGVEDPDCKLMPAETVAGCAMAESCLAGACIPDAWKCLPEFYDEDMAGPSDKVCDCGCGVADPDCANAMVASCDYCDDKGSCNTKACDMMPTIDPANNAVCK